jgi:dolichol-phosphate mannosyltransferase
VSAEIRALRRATFLLLAAFAVARFAFLGVLPLSGDEAYHWNWSRHLAPCYHDHGGVTATGIWLSRRLFGGDSEYSARFAALGFALGAALVARGFARRVTLESGGDPVAAERAGFHATLLALLTPIFAVLAGYISTDPASILFSIWTLDLLHRALRGGRSLAWLGCGLALAGAVQSKFLVLGLGPAMLWTLWLARREPAAPGWRQLATAAAAFAAGMLPMLWWNATHDWATLRFNFQGRHDDLGWHWRHPLEFAGGQLAALSPGIAICAGLVLVRALRGGLARASLGARVLVPAAVVPLALFVAGSFTRTVGIHWAVTAWLPALVLVAVETARPGGRFADAGGRRLWQWSRRIAIGMTVALFLIALLPQWLIRLDLGGVGRSRKVHTRAIAEIWGWPELAAEVVRIRDEMLAAQPARRGVFVITNQFGTSSLLTFYSGQRVDALLWSIVKDHGESLRAWQHLPALRGQDAVFVVKRNVDGELPVLRARFAAVDAPEEFVVHHDGRPIRSFWIVRCRAYDGIEPYPLE